MESFLKNKTVVITGTTSGVGKSLAFKVASKGAHLIMFCRDEKKATELKSAVISDTGNKNVEYIVCDFSSMNSIKKAAEKFCEEYQILDVLVNNAGANFPERKLSEDGIEMTFAVNHIGYFMLTLLLLPCLRKSSDARIINVASQAHLKIDFENLSGEKKYDGYKAYAYSKMANILFTYKLASLLSTSSITVNAVHPGVVRTGIYRNIEGVIKFLIKLFWIFFITPEKSADMIMPLLESPEYKNISGKYFYKTKQINTKKGSYNEDDIDRLWNLSLEITGLNFS